jgi:uncharacterized protein YjbJ (UPF0337 family)
MDMNHIALTSHWEQIKGKLKQRFAQLTDNDLMFAEGKTEELLHRLRVKLSMSEEELERVLDEYYHEATNRIAQAKDAVEGWAEEAAQQVRAKAGVAYEKAREQARTAVSDGEEYIRRNPRESLVGALVAGFVVGLLIRR